MNFILQILFSLFALFFTNISEIVSCEIFNTFESKGFVFYQTKSEYQQAFIYFENQNTNSCLNGENVVTYSEQVAGKDGIGAKGGKHANWVEVLDIRTKITAKKPHVLTVENLSSTRNYNGQTLEGFTGCHSEKALQDYVSVHGGTYQIKGKPANLHGEKEELLNT
ncbi:hypothetical protein FACS1894182_13370 [Bacteroidia bacterium]|nr:hypothetical protein FACS1894182_13370 [Bacteroidia bacterium]